MKRIALAAVVAAGLSYPAAAQEALVGFKVLSPEAALDVAKAALEDCRAQGYQIAVAVVDRAGNLQVSIRDRFAGPHTTGMAYRKAYTAVSFRTDTIELNDLTKAGEPLSPLRDAPNTAFGGGGVRIEAEGSIVGGVGVSGAPGGDLDDACARAGIDAISDNLF